jgi:wyosine [tRNA(Phe)-imidazoG37] synthetase (radical SAM superfamily)
MTMKPFKLMRRVTSTPIFDSALEIDIVPPHMCAFNCIHCRNGEVRRAVLRADIVTAILDASDSTIFSCVNRPHGDISFENYIKGIQAFSQSFKGDLWLRVHLLDGITAIEAEVKKIATMIERIKPKKIFIQTTSPQSKESFAIPIENERLHYFKRFFGKNAMVVERPTADIVR